MDPDSVDFDALLDPEHPEHAAAGCDLSASLGLVWDGWRAFLRDHVLVIGGDDGPIAGMEVLAWADMTHVEQHRVAAGMLLSAANNIASLVRVSEGFRAERQTSS